MTPWQRPPVHLNGWGWQTERRLETLETSHESHRAQLRGLRTLVLYGRYLVAIAASLLAGSLAGSDTGWETASRIAMLIGKAGGL